MTDAPHQSREVNITRLIDDGPLTRFQIGVIICCALVNLFDGADTQSIGVAAPFIADELGIEIANFKWIFSSALVGATLGAATFGPLADRFGRKRLLIIAAVLIGIFTILTAFATSVPTLIAFRVWQDWVWAVRRCALSRYLGICAGAVARGVSDGHVGGVSARRTDRRPIELVSHSDHGVARDFLHRRRRASCSSPSCWRSFCRSRSNFCSLAAKTPMRCGGSLRVFALAM